MKQSSPELIVALDFSEDTEALGLVERLQELPVVYKVGLELFTRSGPRVIEKLVGKGLRVFLDLKLHDIPNTVRMASRRIVDLGVEMFTVHLQGGAEMVSAACGELRGRTRSVRVLGVSVLTSFSDVHWKEVGETVGANVYSAEESALKLIEAGVRWGVGGVVCSPLDLERVRQRFSELYTVVPGVRPAGAPKISGDDQARSATPALARKARASAVVIGRPILLSDDPRGMAEKILLELGWSGQ